MIDLEPFFVDFHCHLDLYPDFENQFRACTFNRIATLAVTTTPRAWPRNMELARSSPMVRVGLGIHPHLVGQYPNELATFEKYLSKSRYVGEVGLDAGPEHYKTFSKQKVVFEAIVKLCAQAGEKILSVHCVRAGRDLLNLVEAHLSGTTNTVVLHWFSGTESEARRAVTLGCYFSINEAMLAKPRAATLLEIIPRHLLLTETDGPFINIGSRAALPDDVRQTTKKIATLIGLTTEETRTMLCKNLATLERTP